MWQAWSFSNKSGDFGTSFWRIASHPMKLLFKLPSTTVLWTSPSWLIDCVTWANDRTFRASVSSSKETCPITFTSQAKTWKKSCKLRAATKYQWAHYRNVWFIIASLYDSSAVEGLIVSLQRGKQRLRHCNLHKATHSHHQNHNLILISCSLSTNSLWGIVPGT